jgi:hypothetical protein
MAQKPKAPAAKKAGPAAVTTTVVVNEKIAEAIENLKKFQPYVKVAYFKPNGEYHLHPRTGFAAVAIDGTAVVTTEEAEPAPNAADASIPELPAGTEKLEF